MGDEGGGGGVGDWTGSGIGGVVSFDFPVSFLFFTHSLGGFLCVETE